MTRDDNNALTRRGALQLLATAPAAAALVWTEVEAQTAQQRAQQARREPAFKPAFFTAHEYATVVLLAEMIIPKDERSGGATDAGVPVFIDFMMVDQPARQVAMRGGLAWIDQECLARVNQTFVGAADADRHALLTDISGLEPPRPDLSHGLAFFRSLRDLVATGFWTSKMGIADLQFLGNKLVKEWTGCPPDALKKLGITTG